jgi:hypothetical protein
MSKDPFVRDNRIAMNLPAANLPESDRQVELLRSVLFSKSV